MRMSKFVIATSVILCSVCGYADDVTTAVGLATALNSSSVGTTVTLGSDIDCTGWTTVDGFSGTLDGQGHKLLNLDAPLFGTITGDIAISNLVVNGANVTATNETCGILLKSVTAANLAVENVAFTGSTLQISINKGNMGFVVGLFSVTGTASFKDCHVDNTCSFALGVNQHGGIAGNGTATGTDATISFTHCTMAATLSTVATYGSQFGGIAGSLSVLGVRVNNVTTYAHLVMDGCTNYSGVAAAWTGSNRGFGGIVYMAGSGSSSAQMGDAVISRCANYGSFLYNGTISGANYAGYGGILGSWSSGKLTMEGCVNYGSIISTNVSDTRPSAVGGLLGFIAAPIHVEVSIADCANRGDITGCYAGGLVGTLSHNKDYTRTTTSISSCMNTGTITAIKDGINPAEAIGALTSGVTYPKIDINGGLYATRAFIGNYAEGTSVSALTMTGNVSLDNSDGLVDGTDLDVLNGYESCGLWKQGHEYPILKTLPDEAAPDTVIATFMDGATVLKHKIVASGWYVLAPDAPVHDGSTFLGWEPSVFTNLTQDTTFVAQYSSGVIVHTVSFLDWDGMPLCEAQEVAHGGSAVAPSVPVRAGYIFIGWDNAFDNVTEDLTIYAQYVSEHISVFTAADFATAVTAEAVPGVTVHLSADIELPANWTAPDFRATLDGAGHSILCPNGGLPIFNNLYGCASNFVVDAAAAGTATSKTLSDNAIFGTVAKTLFGGMICDVTVENLVLEAGDGCTVGFIAGTMVDGASIERCIAARSCSFRQKRAAGAGGIVGAIERTETFAPVDGSGNPVIGDVLALVSDCTNRATIVILGNKSTSNPLVSGGVVGRANVYDAVYKPSMIIRRCANEASFTAPPDTENMCSRIGGIIGERRYGDNSGHAGVLYIIDCANSGDICAPYVSGGTFGGIAGYLYRACEAVVVRCVNRGDIGTAVTGDGTIPVTGNNAGGLFGYVESLYKNNPVVATNCANYGSVTAGVHAGGLVGGFDANAGHSNTSLMFYNCANYGAVIGADEDALTGQIFAEFGSAVVTDSSRQYGAVNCFFMTNNFYAVDSGSVIVMNGLVTAVDVGYKASEARKTLNVIARENDYEPWVLGKVGKGEGAFVAPELACFMTRPANPGFKVVFR